MGRSFLLNIMKNISHPLLLGYVPYDSSLTHPADRRRFCRYAQRKGLTFEIADPKKAYDVVIVSEGGDLSVWSRYRKGKVIFDMVNAYLDVPLTEIKGLFRGVAKYVTGQCQRLTVSYWKAVQEMCGHAGAVVCGSPEQADRIRSFQANVHPILDYHGMYDKVKENYESGSPFRLVWEGLPHNVEFFSEIRKALLSLHQKFPLSLHVITAPQSKKYLRKFWTVETKDILPSFPFPTVLHPWDERTVSDIIRSCDLALIPLPAGSPFNTLKPENKLLIFWRMGMPTVTSAIPSYVRVMGEAGLSMFCRSSEQWQQTLEKFIISTSARSAAGEKGKRYLESHCGEAGWLEKWDAVFESIGKV
ncbi:MAG: hypothetical protein IPN19_06675 [Elusimicrobia bacterium]|nr:hypothetical protein [Elusimicrobiota bacterium]